MVIGNNQACRYINALINAFIHIDTIHVYIMHEGHFIEAMM